MATILPELFSRYESLLQLPPVTSSEEAFDEDIEYCLRHFVPIEQGIKPNIKQLRTQYPVKHGVETIGYSYKEMMLFRRSYRKLAQRNRLTELEDKLKESFSSIRILVHTLDHELQTIKRLKDDVHSFIEEEFEQITDDEYIDDDDDITAGT